MTTDHDEGQESLHSDLPSDFPLEPIDGRPLFDLDAWVETRTKGYRCWLCQRVSYHPEDERQQYCPCCGGPGLPKLCEHDPDGSKMMGKPGEGVEEHLLARIQELRAELRRQRQWSTSVLNRMTKEMDALRGETATLRRCLLEAAADVDARAAEIEKMKRHHDLFCRCQTIRYGSPGDQT